MRSWRRPHQRGIITNAKAVSENHYVFSRTGVTIGSDLAVTYIATNGTPIDLKEGSDYKITYSNNKKVSTDKAKATYTISFLGNYKGTPALKNVRSKSVSINDYSFTISPVPIANEAHEPYEEGDVQVRVELPDVVYGGKPGIYKSTPYVTINGSTLAASNYVVSYFTDDDCEKPLNKKNKITLAEGQIEAPVFVMISAKGSVPGKGNFTGIIKKSYLVKRAVAGEVFDLGKARVTLYQKGYTPGAKTNKKLSSVSFNGKPRYLDDADIGGTVLVEYKVDGKKYEALTEGVHYELVYINNINKGKAVIIVKGKEGSKYIGSVKTGFTISALKIHK